jgi:hypothetical protein
VSLPASPPDVELVDVELELDVEVAALLDPLAALVALVVLVEVAAPPPAPAAPPEEQAERPSATTIKRILMRRSVADRGARVQPRRQRAVSAKMTGGLGERRLFRLFAPRVRRW